MDDSLPIEAQIMRAAKEHFGKADALIYALEREGIRGYTDSQISKWCLGQLSPRSSVLLAAARAAGISIDAYLYPAPDRLTAVERAVEGLTRRVEAIEEGGSHPGT